MVGPASVSHRHERPLSDGRQPTERDIEAAAVGEPATSQGGIWIRIASSGRADEPGQRTVSSARLAWRALCLLADAPMLPAWDTSGRGHWAQLRRDPRPLPHPVLRSATQAKSPVHPGLVCLGRLATYRLRRSCTAASGGRRTGPLPGELAELARYDGPAESFDTAEFYRRVADREQMGCTPGQAREHAMAVMSTVVDQVSEGERNDLASQLPADYGELLR